MGKILLLFVMSGFVESPDLKERGMTTGVE